ncbi:carbohydrate binding family 9 domain-containing protein [Sphingomonas sp.]|uniref:carbohydrate binding family 9 domain-containing protein n=1 Tax=Sphingomonas sp. TaxID=28214 RepID=UPI002DBF1978|nr:DUF5916 domain-containing protein [Sphingomonas sp.]HEU4967559.1 DUF5916 domain-containing protein [Sphingomonas sp.]
MPSPPGGRSRPFGDPHSLAGPSAFFFTAKKKEATLHHLSLLALLPTLLAAQQPEPQSTSAVRTAGRIKLDGHLDDPDWSRAKPLDRFFEHYPGDRIPAPEHTEVRLLYDDHNLYVGFRLWLKDRSRLRTPFVRRDKVGSSHDYVQVYLDPQGSRRGSYLFRINARGTKTDGFQSEAQQSETLDPDYDWDEATSIDPKGWSAELRIPLSTLRISRAGAQTWAVIVTRGVPREQNTQMATAGFPHDSSCFLCYASEVSFPDLRPDPERLIVTPSATVTGRRDRVAGRHDEGLKLQPSLDAKWLPDDGTAVDLTVNPDFSQVEADQALLTANQRFALSLPEKRPFFREGADLVTTSIPVVYTRSILGPDYGLRVTRRDSALEATAFAARDGGRPAIIEPSLLDSSLVLPDFDSWDGFARMRRNFAGGDIGGLGVVKANTDGSRNIVAGVDASRATGSDRFVAQLLASDTRNPDRPDLSPAWNGRHFGGSATFAEWNHSGKTVWTLRYQRYSPGFRSWLGYVPRVGYQQEHAEIYRPFYSTAKLLNTINPYVSADALQAIGKSGGEEHDIAAGLVLAGYKNLAADISWHPDNVVLDTAGVGHRTHYLAFSFSINPAARIPLISVSGQTGRVVDYATGDLVPGTTLKFRAVARPLDRLELEARRETNDLEGLHGEPHRLHETINQVIATWYFRANFYALLNWQDYRSRRRFPDLSLTHRTAASLQFNWEVSRDFQAYWGVRTGSSDAGLAGTGRRSTEIYLKLARTFRR